MHNAQSLRYYMKKRKILLTVFLMLVLVLTFGACGGAAKLSGPINGKWYYIHDLENVGLSIRDNGTAVLDGRKYDCSYDSGKIHLADKSGTQDLRYILEGENQMYLYKTAVYKREGIGTSDGLIGLWIDEANGHSNFEFTAEGTFREDSYIPGYYSVNESEGSILLVYNDQYYDTTIYFTLEGDELTVEYPWAMVRQDK